MMTTKELEKYQGCFYEDGQEACEKEINVRTSFVLLLFIVINNNLPAQ